METPVSSLSLGQASGSNLTPQDSAGAHGSSLKSRPSESDGEQDELMRAIALSLGENISEASSPSVSTRGSNSGTTNPVSPPPSSPASSSNQTPQAPAGAQLAPSSSPAPVSSLRSTPLDNEGKQDDFLPFEK